MIKKLFSLFIILTVLFNFQLSAFASETNNIEVIKISQTPESFLIEGNKDSMVKDLFSPDEHNLDLLIGVILSVIPGFGAGHFWLGNTDDGWFFLKLDLVMLALPFAIALVSTVFSSLNVVKASTGDNMPAGINIFNILGLVAWAAAFGVKIWEIGSVWRYASQLKDKDKYPVKINFSPEKVELTVNF